MALDVNELDEADVTYVQMNDNVGMNVWSAEAWGVAISYQELDLTAKYWVSPIWNMRQRGVALVDASGQMVKCERRDR